MEYGVPKEIRDLEMRVGLTPAGVQALVQAGHTVYVERGAGTDSGFSDEVYRKNGATLVYSADEAYGRADVVVKVARPAAAEHHRFRFGQTILSFFHLPVSSRDLYEALVKSKITAISYETIQEDDGTLPVLLPLSEAAGRLAPVIAGQLLMKTHGGRGTLLSGIPGVSPAAVAILGAGVLGFNAVRAFLGVGAQVTVLDKNIRTLRHIDDMFAGQANTLLANSYNIGRVADFADVLVICVLSPGQRAPILVPRDVVARMRPGSVIIDFSIDQGGSCETSRPTTLRDQTYIEEQVIHHCVPNVTALVARTSSYAITNAALPYLLAVGQHGLPDVFRELRPLARGVNLYEGCLAHPGVAAGLNQEVDANLPDYLLVGGVA